MQGLTSYREAIAQALEGGWRFCGLHASEGGAVVRTLLVARDGTTRLETAAVDGGTAPSIVDLALAADWDEREAHDLHGVRFDGHEPLRPLVRHDLELDAWTVPVRGPDPYQVAVGPVHAGVIESGHFRFHLVGERILHLDARLFYKHRGLERAAEGNTLEDGLAWAARACAACSVANTVSYALACEDALGLGTTAELARVRTILLELERTWNHLNDIAAVCAGVGLAAGNNRFAGLTERARRLNAHLTGHRFLSGTVQVGGSSSPSTPTASGRRGRSSRRSSPRRAPPGASSSSTPPSKTASPTSASSELTTPQGSAPSGPLRVPLGSRRTHAPEPEHAWPTTGSLRSFPSPARRGRPCAPGAARARAPAVDRAARHAPRRPGRADRRETRQRGKPNRDRPRREPARCDQLHRRA